MEVKASSPTTGGYIPGLDGMRGIAATLVFWYHTWGHWGYPVVAFTFFGTSIDLTWIYHYGTEGVSIFFVLSGFLLSQPFWKALLGQRRPVNLRDFFRRRLLRIYPAYLVAVIIFALFYDTQHPLATRILQVVTHLTMTHNFFEVTVFNLSSPLWSVATEFQLYLLLPVVFLVLAWAYKRIRRPWFLALAAVVVSGLLGMMFLTFAYWFLAHFHVDPRIVHPGGQVLAHLPIVGLSYFATGIAAGYAYQAIRARARAGQTISRLTPELMGLGALLLLAVIAMASPPFNEFNPVIWPNLPVIYGVIVTSVALGGRALGLTRVFDWGPIRWLGTISYSFYLYHDFVLWNVFDRLPKIAPGLLTDGTVKGLVAFVLSVLTAAASYYLIERRFHAAPSEPRTARQPAPAATPVEAVD